MTKVLQSIINAGIPEDISFQEKKRLRIINIILFISASIPIPYIVQISFMGLHELVFIELVIFSTSIITYSLKGKLKKSLSKYILLFIIPIELLYFPLFVGDLGEEYFFFTFIILGAYIIDSRPILILHVLFITILLLTSKYLVFHTTYHEKYYALSSQSYYFNILISVILISIAALVFKFDTISFRSTIIAQTIELNNKVIALEERERFATNLLRELNHRIKNNLQMVSSLFTMQFYSCKNTEIRQALDSIRYRVDTIAILHQHLYTKKHALEPDLKKYIKDLTLFILAGSGMEDKVDIKINIDKIFLKIETTTHIGLIINELLTNTFKYGVNIDTHNNKVLLNIKKQENCILIDVQDSGTGFPEFNAKRSYSPFGLDLIRTIARQYGGSVGISNWKGAQVKVKLYI